MSSPFKIALAILLPLLFLFTFYGFHSTGLLSFGWLDRVQVAVDRTLASFLFGVVTEEGILQKYKTDKVRILLVPGHDHEYPGAIFKPYTEAELNLEITRALYDVLGDHNNIEVLSARRLDNGDYIDELKEYFEAEEKAINDFISERRQTMSRMLLEQSLRHNVTIDHNFAPSVVAFRLYGINKWANENDIDIQLHIHLNDYPGRTHGQPGEYSGFAIYVPEGQFPNAPVSINLAEKIKEELSLFLHTSNYPPEASTIIPAQELIALGSNASQRSASILIEYGYIYEPQFIRPAVREVILPVIANLTYLGIERYLDENFYPQASRLSSVKSFSLDNSLRRGLVGDPSVTLMQLALRKEGLYPPPGRTFNDCPITGTFGPCTEQAVIDFQEKYYQEVLSPAGLSSGTGFVGEATLKKLRNILH